MPKRRPSDENWATVHLSVPAGQYERIGALADKLETTRAAILRHGLTLAIDWAEERVEAFELGMKQIEAEKEADK